MVSMVAPPRRDASLRFSVTVSDLNSDRSSGTSTSPALTAARGEPGRTGAPPSPIRPASGSSRPAIVSISVVLPAPFGPSRAITVPGSRLMSTPRSTGWPARRD